MSLANSSYKETQLGDVLELKYGKNLPESIRARGDVPVFGSNGLVGNHAASITSGETIIVGRKGSIGAINYSSVGCWPIDTTYYIDRGCSKINLRWLDHLLKSLDLARLNKAVAIPGLNRDDVYRLKVLIPDAEEQQRIAAILDQAEALRAKRRQALAKLDTLTQSLFLEMFGDPFANLGNWPVQPLGDVSEFENGDRSSKYPSGDDLVENGIVFLNGKNIVEDQLDLTSCVFITNSKFSSLSRGKARSTDLIITLRGTLGSCCIFRETRGPAFINAQMMIIRVANSLLPEFLHAVLTSRPYKAKFDRMSTGVAVPQLTSAQLRDLPVIMPPISTQKKFLAKSEAIVLVKSIIARHHKTLESLLESAQHRAFRGEL